MPSALPSLSNSPPSLIWKSNRVFPPTIVTLPPYSGLATLTQFPAAFFLINALAPRLLSIKRLKVSVLPLVLVVAINSNKPRGVEIFLANLVEYLAV